MIISCKNTALNFEIQAPPSKSIYHRELIVRFLLGDSKYLSPVNGDNDDVLATKAVLSAIHEAMSSASDSDVILPCNESGSTLRFMIPVASALLLGKGRSDNGHSINGRSDNRKLIFTTKGRLFDRPLDELKDAMAPHGISIEKNPEDRTIIVTGTMTPGEYTIDGSVSSQYISGLIMALTLFTEESIINVTGEIKSVPYIELTQQVLEKYSCPAERNGNTYHPYPGGYPVHSNKAETSPHPDSFDASPHPDSFDAASLLSSFKVEGDWSNGAFLLCLSEFSDIRVTNLNPDSKQGDKAILKYLDMVHKCRAAKNDDTSSYKSITLDCSDIPDITPYMAVTAPFVFDKAVFTGISRLRIKESDRAAAVCAQLSAVGINTEETEDTLTVYGASYSTTNASANDSAENSTKKEQPIRLSSYHDHRMAMCAILLMVILKVDIEIDDIDCVKKSFPELLNLPFFK